MWYKDENHDSYTYSAISNDLYHWDVCGKEIDYNSHEGPNVFELGGKKWMITDEWNGLGVYETQDYTHWERQGIFCGTAAAQLEVKDSRLVYNRNQQFEMRL